MTPRGPWSRVPKRQLGGPYRVWGPLPPHSTAPVRANSREIRRCHSNAPHKPTSTSCTRAGLDLILQKTGPNSITAIALRIDNHLPSPRRRLSSSCALPRASCHLQPAWSTQLDRIEEGHPVTTPVLSETTFFTFLAHHGPCRAG